MYSLHEHKSQQLILAALGFRGHPDCTVPAIPAKKKKKKKFNTLSYVSGLSKLTLLFDTCQELT